MDTDDVIDILNDLIETSKDGEYGFRTSAEHLQNPDIKALFLQRAEQCRQAAAELQSAVIELGGKADDSGSASGAVHRGWVAVKGSIAGWTDLAILEEVERGEDSALADYRKAMQQSLPPSVQPLVQRQFEGVQRNHNQVRALRDQARMAKQSA